MKRIVLRSVATKVLLFLLWTIRLTHLLTVPLIVFSQVVYVDGFRLTFDATGLTHSDMLGEFDIALSL